MPKRGKRIVVTIGIDADTLFTLERIADNRRVQRAIVLREALNKYAQDNDPFPKQLKEVIIKDASDRAREQYPEKFGKGHV